MMSYSQAKHSEQLELANGAGKPAHVSDTRTFVEEAAKSFAGMEGFDSLLGQLEMLATQPGIQVAEFVSNPEVPEDLWKQLNRVCYGGTPLQYRKEILSKSQHSDRLFDPGILPYALYEVSRDISDLEVARKRHEYLQPVAVRPSDKATLEKSYKKYDRDSFELFQLQELQTARTDAPTVQYNVGCIIFGNFPDIMHTWSRMWREMEPHTMKQMREIMQKMVRKWLN